MIPLPFDAWKEQVPACIRSERFWEIIAYQKALYLYDLAWQDTALWLKDCRGHELARQIIRSAVSISANIEEGFGRGFGKQLVYFYTVSLGSARETKGWYYRAKVFLPGDMLNHRLGLTGEVIALIITELSRQKRLQANISHV